MGHLFNESQLKACDGDLHLMSLTVLTPLLRNPIAFCRLSWGRDMVASFWLSIQPCCRAAAPVAVRSAEAVGAWMGSTGGSNGFTIPFPEPFLRVVEMGRSCGLTQLRTFSPAASCSPVCSVSCCTRAPRDGAARSARDHF